MVRSNRVMPSAANASLIITIAVIPDTRYESLTSRSRRENPPDDTRLDQLLSRHLLA